MSLTRRQFNRLSLLSIASTSTSAAFFTRVAEAAEATLDLGSLSTRQVFRDLLNTANGNIVGSVSSPPNSVTREAANAIYGADQEFTRRAFNTEKTQLARTGQSARDSYLWGQRKQERLGPNVGFGFVQEFQDDLSAASITGPTMTALHIANRYLRDRQVSPEDIAGSLIPTRSQFDDWGTWEGDDDPEMGGARGVGFTNFRTVLGEVTSRYDLKENSPQGGFGEVELTIEAGGHPRRDLLVRVYFNAPRRIDRR
jgi:hypothetical protein